MTHEKKGLLEARKSHQPARVMNAREMNEYCMTWCTVTEILVRRKFWSRTVFIKKNWSRRTKILVRVRKNRSGLACYICVSLKKIQRSITEDVTLINDVYDYLLRQTYRDGMTERSKRVIRKKAKKRRTTNISKRERLDYCIA